MSVSSLFWLSIYRTSSRGEQTSLSLYLPFNLFSRPPRDTEFFSFWPISPPSEIPLLWMSWDFCVATKWGRFIMGGKKVGRGARWLRALPSAEGGCCGGGAMVVIACSTCLNSSHIHLGPSFTLNCFYNRLRAWMWVTIFLKICIFTKFSRNAWKQQWAGHHQSTANSICLLTRP